MNKFYFLQKFGGQKNDEMIELDKQRRIKIEKKVGKMSDEQWFQYKNMKNVARSKF